MKMTIELEDDLIDFTSPHRRQDPILLRESDATAIRKSVLAMIACDIPSHIFVDSFIKRWATATQRAGIM